MTCSYHYSIPGEETPHIVSYFMDALRLTRKMHGNQMWWCMSVTSKLKRLRPEDCELEDWELEMSGPTVRLLTQAGVAFPALAVLPSLGSPFLPGPTLLLPIPHLQTNKCFYFSKTSRNMKGKIKSAVSVKHCVCGMLL